MTTDGGLDGIRRWAYGAGMPLPAGHFRIGPERGQLFVRTFRQGVAATVGHDLKLEFTGWSADIDVRDDDDIEVSARVDLGTLVVRDGTGGVKPLSDRDRREIAYTARKLLDVDKYPEAVFGSNRVTRTDSGAIIVGSLRVRDVHQPCMLDVTETMPDHYRGTTSVLLSSYGVKQYTAFFGALKMADRVEVDVVVDLSEEE